MEFKIIGKMKTDFPGKFGIPRQSGLVKSLKGRIVLEPEYRKEGILKGIEDFSHLWILWVFSENLDAEGESRWSPTVRPPRLGGNTRLGVFATRSPFRPNPIGMSVVKLDHVDHEAKEGPVLYVTGADMVDGTPIVDIKPYIPCSDIVNEAYGGFTETVEYELLKVSISPDCEGIELFDELPTDTKQCLISILENDPRPHYQNDPERVYRFEYAGLHIGFKVEGKELSIVKLNQ